MAWLHLDGRGHDLGGGFIVRRLLPHARQRSVGPFVFLDHMGPHDFPPGEGVDVRPHPHIGLSTLTWLWDGAMMHRDSVGSVQRIAPGDVNWMTAGRGIVHSERTPDDLRRTGQRLHGLQSWLALPEADAEIAPAFQHVPSAELPTWDADGVQVCVVAGHALGRRSPVRIFSDTLYLALTMRAEGRFVVPAEHSERAVYVAEGEVYADDGTRLPIGQLHVLAAGDTPLLQARQPSRVAVVGGQPLGPRLLWWNFVASTRERIEQAKADWLGQAMGQVPGEHEFIPLPDR